MNKLSVIISSMAICLSTGASARQLQLDDVVSGEFTPSVTEPIIPMADGEHYLQAEGSQILKYSFKTGQVTETVLDLNTVKGDRIDKFSGFILAPGEETILLETRSTPVYRHSVSAEYYIFTIRNNKLEPLSQNGPQRSPAYSPDGHNIAFVRDGNLFLVKMLFGNAEIQVTKDGQPGKILNGIPDWAYEEEFSFTRAFEFSADSRMLAWIRFDESQVDSYSLPFFSTEADEGSYSQQLVSYRPQQYPTAGATLSKASVHSFDIKSSVIRDINVPVDSNTYIPRIKFVENDDNSLFVFTLNRLQNKLEIYSANPRSTLCTLILRQEDRRYIDCPGYMDTWFYNGGFIMQSENDGHNHLYQYNLNGKLVKQLTSGNWEVTRFLGYDAKSGTVYYESNESGMYDNAVWKLDSKGRRTCLTERSGTSCATFSTGMKYFHNSWSSMDCPTRITLRDNSGKVLSTIDDGSLLERKAEEYGLLKKEMFSFKTDDGTELYGWMIKPESASQSNPVPLIMFQYSGPGYNKVLNSWNAGFYPGASFENLLAQNGYAVAVVDGRGTGRRGADFKKQTYLHLGVLEADDQVAAAQYLGGLPYIDGERIAIWGWSYGGYTTLMSMSQGTPVFKCGVAVAPVTDWRYYDAPYTERFMQEPKQNANGYDESSAIGRADKLSGRLLLIHGIDDDNVFLSNSTAYIDALVQNGTDFDLMVYPGKNHSIEDSAYRKHLLQKMTGFFDENLK